MRSSAEALVAIVRFVSGARRAAPEVASRTFANASRRRVGQRRPRRPHRRRAADDGDAVVHDRLEGRLRVEALDRRAAVGAGQQGEPEHHVQAEDVEERQHRERDVVRRPGPGRGGPGTARGSASRLPWVSIAAFGEPAVPLVKMSTARSSAGPVDASAPAGPAQVVEQHARRGPRRPGWRSTCSRAGSALRSSALRVPFAHGPAMTARAPMAASSRVTSGTGLDGFSGTATHPTPSTARYGRDEVPVVGGDDRHPVARLEAQAGEPAPQAGDLLAQHAVGGRLARATGAPPRRRGAPR